MNPPDHQPFTYPLSIDPMRIVLAVGRFVPGLLLFTLIGLACGYYLDHVLVPEKNRHSIKNILLMADVPSGMGTDSFEPRTLDIPILARFLFSPPIIQAVGQQLNTDFDKDRFERHFELDIDYQSDLFTLITHSFKNGEEALSMNRAWTEAILQYGKERQRQEVHQFTTSLEADIALLQEELANVNSNILYITSREAQLDSQDSTASAGLTYEGLTYEGLNNAIVGKQLDLNALNAQIQKVTRDIVSQSPRAERLKELQEELKALLVNYTISNPLVVGKQQEIRQQEELIAQSMKLDPASLSEDEILEFTNTSLSSQLYIKLLELHRERFKMEDELKHYQSINEGRRENLSKRPGAKFQLANLEQRQSELLEKLGRLDAAYESGVYYRKNLPGYLSTFQDPTIDDVFHQSYVKKYGKSLLIYALFLFLFVGLGLLLALRKEFKRPNWSTALQTAIRLRRIPDFMINTQDPIHPIRELWLTLLSRQPVGKRHSILTTLADLGKHENELWQHLVDCIDSDANAALIIDAADQSLTLNNHRVRPLDTQQESTESMLAPVRQSSQESMQHRPLVPGKEPKPKNGAAVIFYLDAAGIAIPRLREIIAQLPPELHLIIRWNTEPNTGLSDLLDHIDQHITLVSPTHSNGELAQSRHRIFTHIFGEPSGLVLLDPPPRGALHRFTAWFESAFFEWKKSQAS